MKGFNFNPGYGDDEIIIQESNPDTLSIKVTHRGEEHLVSVPSRYTFGDLKSVLVEKLGLDSERHKLFFRGKEKGDEDDLQTSGLRNGSKVLIMEDVSSSHESVESVNDTMVVSKGDEAVALIRQEVDNLSMQVEALQCVVDNETKVDDKDFVYLTEMLMRQLLKLDSIDAEGEGRARRKTEVNRVQGLVDMLDSLRSKNSAPVAGASTPVAFTTQWETFEPASSDTSSISPAPSQKSLVASPTPSLSPTPASVPFSTPEAGLSTPNYYPTSPNVQSCTKITQNWEHFE